MQTELSVVSSPAAELERKAYSKPAITHELKMETRAGNSGNSPSLVDPLGVDPLGSRSAQ